MQENTPTHEEASDLAVIIHISDIITKYIMDIIPEDRIKFSTEILDKTSLTEELILELTHELTPVIKEKAYEATRMITSL